MKGRSITTFILLLSATLALCQTPTPPPQSSPPCLSKEDCGKLLENIERNRLDVQRGMRRLPHRKEAVAPPPENPPANPPPVQNLSFTIPADALKGLLAPLNEYTAARKEDADTNNERLKTVEQPRLEKVEIPGQNAKNDLMAAQAEQIRAETAQLIPANAKLVNAQAYLATMQGGYLKLDHLWKLGYHIVDGLAFGFGMAYQNVAGINVQQTGGGAAISNSGNVSAQGGAGGAGGAASSSSASNSSSKSTSAANSSAAASAASNP